MKVILASKNQHKLTELSAILSGLGFEIALESEYGLDIDVDETGTTFEENSLLKAEAVMKASGLPVLADDSGLMVDSLDGAPGVYSARYGHKNSDAERIDYLLANLKDVPAGSRAARSLLVILFFTPFCALTGVKNFYSPCGKFISDSVRLCKVFGFFRLNSQSDLFFHIF